MSRAPVRLAVLLVVASAAAGCGYALVGTSRGSLPEEVKNLYVTTFVNETPRVGLEQLVTDAVLRELATRARLKPVSQPEQADAVLSGRLLSYSVAPVRFDETGRALEYEISLVAKVSLVERATEKPLYENPGYVFRQPYKVPPASAYADVESAAVQGLARPFAQSLVTTILEGF